jgi:hypothetical protein
MPKPADNEWGIVCNLAAVTEEHKNAAHKLRKQTAIARVLLDVARPGQQVKHVDRWREDNLSMVLDVTAKVLVICANQN